MDERLRRGETQRQLGDGLVQVPRLEVQWGASGEHTRHKVHMPLLVSKSGPVCILPYNIRPKEERWGAMERLHQKWVRTRVLWQTIPFHSQEVYPLEKRER